MPNNGSIAIYSIIAIPVNGISAKYELIEL